MRALRQYESALLSAYQSFLQALLAAAGTPPGAAAAPRRGRGGALDSGTAVRCMAGLLEALPHFNYRSDLLRALTPWLASPEKALQATVQAAIVAVLQGDKRGDAALEALQLMADLVRLRHCALPPAALQPLKAVKLDDSVLTQLRADKEAAGARGELSKKERAKKWIEERRKAREGAKRAERAKTVGGAARLAATAAADAGLDRDLAELDAAPAGEEEHKQLQSAQLEAMCARAVHGQARAGAQRTERTKRTCATHGHRCEIYFRVLKDAASGHGASVRPPSWRRTHATAAARLCALRRANGRRGPRLRPPRARLCWSRRWRVWAGCCTSSTLRCSPTRWLCSALCRRGDPPPLQRCTAAPVPGR